MVLTYCFRPSLKNYPARVYSNIVVCSLTLLISYLHSRTTPPRVYLNIEVNGLNLLFWTFVQRLPRLGNIGNIEIKLSTVETYISDLYFKTHSSRLYQNRVVYCRNLLFQSFTQRLPHPSISKYSSILS